MWKLSLHDAISFPMILIVKLPETCTFTFIRRLELSCFSRDEFSSPSCANVYWNCLIEEVRKKEFTINRSYVDQYHYLLTNLLLIMSEVFLRHLLISVDSQLCSGRVTPQTAGSWTRDALGAIRIHMCATQELDLSGCFIGDDDVTAILSNLRYLERLILDNCQKL